MKLYIEDYFGNEVLKIDVILGDELNNSQIETVANKYGYNLADSDFDNNGLLYHRIQEVNVDNSEDENKTDLIAMVKEFLELSL